MNSLFLIFSQKLSPSDLVVAWLDKRIEVTRWITPPFPNSIIILTEKNCDEFSALFENEFPKDSYMLFQISDGQFGARIPDLVWAEIYRSILEPDAWQAVFGPGGTLEKKRAELSN